MRSEPRIRSTRSSFAVRPPTDRPDSGFTIIEVVVALAIVAVSIVAIGSVMSTNVRGVMSLERHVELMQATRALMATAVPPAGEFAPGERSGQYLDHQWQVDVGPLDGGWIVPDADVRWLPALVRLRVRSPSGAIIELKTVRLMRRPQQ